MPQALIQTIAFEISFALGETETRLKRRMIAGVFRETGSEVAQRTADILLLSAFHLGWGGGVVSQSPASISCANSPHDLLRYTSAPPHSSSCRPPARQLRRPPDPVLNLNVLIALQTPLLATPSLPAGPILFLSRTSHLPLFLQPSRLPRLLSAL